MKAKTKTKKNKSKSKESKMHKLMDKFDQSSDASIEMAEVCRKRKMPLEFGGLAAHIMLKAIKQISPQTEMLINAYEMTIGLAR